MEEKGAAWSFRCTGCGHWTAAVVPDTAARREVGDEVLLSSEEWIHGLPSQCDGEKAAAARDTAVLRSIGTARDQSNADPYALPPGIGSPRGLLDRLQSLTIPTERRLLEIGGGSGGFLEQAAASGFRSQGIERCEPAGKPATDRGCVVRTGRFPQGLGDDERFDIIVVNGMLDQVPDPLRFLAACRRHVRPGGLVAIHVPDARSLSFNLARLAAAVGVTGPWQRVWRMHARVSRRHFFSPASLEGLCVASGFEPAALASCQPHDRVRELSKSSPLSHELTVARRLLAYGCALVCGATTMVFGRCSMVRIYRDAAGSHEPAVEPGAS